MTETARALRELNPDSAGRGASSGRGDDVPTTYYGRPLLKKPHWGWEVVTYLFLGGIMGGSGILVALADGSGDPEDEALARSARYVAFVLAVLCPAILVKHLGRPERFLHMMRVVKFRSVMSMGVWGLIAFSLSATLGAAGQAACDGILPRPLRFIRHLAPRGATGPLSALFGAFIAGYTGVLLSATAVPVWAIGKRHIPAFSVCSGLSGACALNGAVLALAGASEATERKVERLEMVAAAAELLVLLDFKRHAGEIGAPMFGGKRGEHLAAYTMLGGIVVSTVLKLLPFRARPKTLLASALTLVGGYALRYTLIEAGKASADDPLAAARRPR